MSVWLQPLHHTFFVFFFFFNFNFFWRVNNNITWIHCAEDKNALFMSHMVLFTHLKIILLQCFQFSVSVKISCIQTEVCVWLQLKKLAYFTIQLIFATIHEPYCTFWYYLWVPLYYFNYLLALYTIQQKIFSFS